MTQKRHELDHAATEAAFYAKYEDRGLIFTVRHRGVVVGSVDTRECDGLGKVSIPRGARFIEIDHVHHDVLIT